jgi:hypothetical protein
MALKHRITINVSDPHGRTANVLKGADARLPARLIRFLFGDFQQVYLLSPGQTVESVDIHEVKEGGAKMSKMSELAMVLSELKQCGESLMHISDELTEIFSGDNEEKKKTARKTEESEKPKPEPEESKMEYTFTEVRTFLADKSRAGHTAEVKKILAAHGADKLSDLDKAEYAAVMAEAEVLE